MAMPYLHASSAVLQISIFGGNFVLSIDDGAGYPVNASRHHHSIAALSESL